MQEASPSLLVSKLGIDPLPAAFACLISALLLALLYPHSTSSTGEHSPGAAVFASFTPARQGPTHSSTAFSL